MALQPKVDAPLMAAVGALESDAFHWQAKCLEDSWSIVGAPVTVPATNHFTILDALADPGSVLAGALQGLDT